MNKPLIIGILSDTHGHLDPKASAVLAGADLILHAGDVGGPDILALLRSIGPVFSVRGNMDGGPWAKKLPLEEYIEAGQVHLYLVHDLSRSRLDPAAADVRVVVSGHTHRPEIVEKEGVLYINPGSATLPRGGHKATVALLETSGKRLVCRHVEL